MEGMLQDQTCPDLVSKGMSLANTMPSEWDFWEVLSLGALEEKQWRKPDLKRQQDAFSSQRMHYKLFFTLIFLLAEGCTIHRDGKKNGKANKILLPEEICCNYCLNVSVTISLQLSLSLLLLQVFLITLVQLVSKQYPKTTLYECLMLCFASCPTLHRPSPTVVPSVHF